MVFKKPYAFLIKYFKLINFVLSMLLIYLGYKLNVIHTIIKDIYNGKVTNYTNFNKIYIGFKIYLVIFIILITLSFIILLLNKKKKPLMDYIYNVIYIFIIIFYTFIINGLFIDLNKTIIEQSDLNVYSGISFWITVPLIYFIVKFLLISIGFSLKKFDFTKDIIELKKDEKDNEEIEVIFDKNTYKYKRGLRRSFREFKYYYLENRFLIINILGVVGIILFGTFFSFNMFNKNKVKINKNFEAAGFNYKIKAIYETKYDLNYNVVDNDYKFIIVEVDAINKTANANSIDYNRIRLIYKDKYIYANNYYNKYFYDLGTPYNGETLLPNQLYNYIFIFKVPIEYKSNKYKIKFYDKNIYDKNEIKGTYKELSIKSKFLNNNRSIKEINLKENGVFNKSSYGNSNITITNYETKNTYVYDDNGTKRVLRDKDINNSLIILDYKLELDEKYAISKYFENDKEFFNKFISITYSNNRKELRNANIKCIDIVDNKAILSAPYNVLNSDSLSVNIELRNIKLTYKLK